MSHHDAFRCQPLLFERVWGGDSLKTLFNREVKTTSSPIGESWELSDRPEAESLVAEGEFKGLSLHDLWRENRIDVFGPGYESFDRFPVICKILDAREALSIQVHPSHGVALRRKSEEKSELWYVARRDEEAVMYLGLKEGVGAGEVRTAVKETRLDELLRKFKLHEGESVFIPSGMLHGIGAGYVIFEIQENSDTTYRMYDWGRVGIAGKPRDLHLDEAMECVEEFGVNSEPRLPGDGVLLSSHGFLIEECTLDCGGCVPHRDPAHFMICTVVAGTVEWNERVSREGDFILVPAYAPALSAGALGAKVLLTTISA